MDNARSSRSDVWWMADAQSANVKPTTPALVDASSIPQRPTLANLQKGITPQRNHFELQGDGGGYSARRAGTFGMFKIVAQSWLRL